MPGAAMEMRILTLLVAGCVLAMAQPARQQPEVAPPTVLREIQRALGSGESEAASRELVEALHRYPRDPVLHSFLGVLEAQRNHYRAAESAFRRAIELGPDYAPAYLNLGRLYQQNVSTDPKATKKGIAVYQALLKLEPSSAEANYQIALLYSLDGAPSRALEHLDKLPEAEKNRASVLAIRSAALAEEGRRAEARKTGEAAVQAGGATVPLLLGLARIAYREKDFEGALGYLAHARDIEPGNAGIHFFFGMVCVEMDLVVEASKSLRKAVELAPDNPYYNYALGAVIANGKEWEKAIPYFEKYVAGRPDDPRGRLALATAHFNNYQTALARKELEGLVDQPATAAGARYHLGLIDIREGKFEAAVSELRQAVGKNRDYAEAYAELGFAYLQLDRLEEAKKALDRALELRPEDRRANMTLLAYYRKTADPRAKQQARRFAEINKKRTQRAKMFLRTIEARPY